MKPALTSWLDLVYPTLCPGCSDPLPADHFPALCVPCQGELHPLDAPFCDRCGERFHGAALDRFACPNCEGRDLAFDFARSGYHAHGLIRDFIHRFKYNRQMSLATVLGQLLLRNWEDRRIERYDDWVLVPVPLHRARQRVRQFNQAEELCRVVSRETGLPWQRALRRIRPTVAQARLDREDRTANLAGAFALHPRWEVERTEAETRVLLVDDVFTTGATAHECAKVLKSQENVGKVGVITVARAGSPPLG